MTNIKSFASSRNAIYNARRINDSTYVVFFQYNACSAEQILDFKAIVAGIHPDLKVKQIQTKKVKKYLKSKEFSNLLVGPTYYVACSERDQLKFILNIKNESLVLLGALVEHHVLNHTNTLNYTKLDNNVHSVFVNTLTSKCNPVSSVYTQLSNVLANLHTYHVNKLLTILKANNGN